MSRASFKVEWADNGAVAEYLLRKQDFDIAVLDLGLPMVDGLTVLKRVREAGRSLPILVLTALDALEHRVAGLQAGADDYLTKPFDFPELEARLQALLRRGRPAGPAVQLRGLSLDRSARRATVAGEPVELSPGNGRCWSCCSPSVTASSPNPRSSRPGAARTAAPSRSTSTAAQEARRLGRGRAHRAWPGLSARSHRHQRVKPAHGRSLHRQLLLWLLLPQFVLWLVAAFGAFRLATRHADELVDASLLQSARALARQIKPTASGLFIDLPSSAQDILAADPDDRVLYLVSSPPGALLLGDVQLPPPPSAIQRASACCSRLGPWASARCLAFSSASRRAGRRGGTTI